MIDSLKIILRIALQIHKLYHYLKFDMCRHVYSLISYKIILSVSFRIVEEYFDLAT